MLAGFGVMASPVGAPVTARFTAPVNPPARLMVTVAVVLVPCGMLRELGATASEKLGAVKVAVTLFVAVVVGVNLHVVVVATHAPDQPANVLPAAAVAVRVKGTAAKVAMHAQPQLIAAGLDVNVAEGGAHGLDVHV